MPLDYALLEYVKSLLCPDYQLQLQLTYLINVKRPQLYQKVAKNGADQM